MSSTSTSLFGQVEPTQTHPAPQTTGVIASFFVPGVPATQGSKRAFIPKGWTRPIIVEDCKKNKDWRGDVKRFALEAVADHQWEPGARPALRLEIVFFMPRPKGHTGKHGLLPSAPKRPVTMPDLTKLLRAAEDALKGILWGDDSQVVDQVISKHFASDFQPPGAKITVAIVEE